MKKTLPLLLVLSSLTLVGCGSKTTEHTPQDPLNLEGFNTEYNPVKQKNQVNTILKDAKKTEGVINVALDFEGMQDAWKALGTEYSRLCGGAVTVNIVSGLSSGEYEKRLKQEETDPNTTWDIVQGNLLNNCSASCINMRTDFGTENSYAGNKEWSEILDENAYVTDVSGQTDFTYLVNSENLLTAWFVNTKASNEAGVTNCQPKTWNALIDMLDKMQSAGYKYPLGFSLNKDSVNNSQFAWLLRVYGDYYYRNQYVYTTKEDTTKSEHKSVEFKYDPTDENIENNKKYTLSHSRLYEVMLGESDNALFNGPTSDRYFDFSTNLAKLGKYINPFNIEKSFEEVRTEFKSQKDKSAPQVFLDYSGNGLSFLNTDALKNNLKFFDYPTMESEFVESNTVTRDVGGNGGYLSIFSSRPNYQQKLNKDFLKFVLSPYGQTIYYNTLKNSVFVPKGLTTVKNDLVVIPENWKTFFESKEVTYTGRADNNGFIDAGILSLCSDSDTKTIFLNEWQKLLTTYGNDGETAVNTFNTNIYTDLTGKFAQIMKNRGWPEDANSFTHYDEPNLINA